jgi:hypothetical protein
MANTWMSDSELAEQLGDGWVDDTEISLSAVNSEGDKKAALLLANTWLVSQGTHLRVLSVRLEAVGGGDLEWLVDGVLLIG